MSVRPQRSCYELRTVLPELKVSNTSEHNKVAIYARFSPRRPQTNPTYRAFSLKIISVPLFR
jgi:hypothetical protein